MKSPRSAPEDDSKTGSVQSIGKAVELLDALDKASDGMHLAALAREVGLNRSTVYRILSTLEADRIVMRDQHLRYRLGFRLFELGSVAKDHHIGFHETAAASMRRFAERLGLTAFLAVRVDDRALFVEQAVYGDPHYVAFPAGTSLPLNVGAVSHVLLAWADPDLVEQVLSRPLPHVSPMSITDPKRLRLELAEVRRNDIAVIDGDVTVGLAAIGAPVRNRAGDVVAAVSLSGLSTRLLGSERACITAAVQDLAAEVSAGISAVAAGR